MPEEGEAMVQGSEGLQSVVLALVSRGGAGPLGQCVNDVPSIDNLICICILCVTRCVLIWP